MVRGLIELPSIDEAWYKTTTCLIHRFAMDNCNLGGLHIIAYTSNSTTNLTAVHI